MKKIFFVTPIGTENSTDRQYSDFVMHTFLEPVAHELDYQVLRSDLLNTVEKIDDSVIQQLQESELVIVDVTGLNPNVMFEFGIRYGIKKPYVVMTQDLSEIPFDIRNIRTLEYTVTAPDIAAFNQKLRAMIQVVTSSEKQTNSKPNSDRSTSQDSPSLKGEEMGEEMAMKAIQTGDMSQVESFMKLAKMFGVDSDSKD